MELDRFHCGEREYLESLVRTHGHIVLKVARRFGEDEDHILDLVQETWIQVLEKRTTFRGSGAFEAWLHRVATRVCISEYRRRKTGRKALDRMNPEDAPHGKVATPMEENETEELGRLLDEALHELTEREHDAIYLRIIENRSPDETARIMGVKKSTVRSTVRHGVQRLRKILEGSSHDMS